MLEALKSRYITCGSASCKKERPRAAAIATLILVAQGRTGALSANRTVSKLLRTPHNIYIYIY